MKTDELFILLGKMEEEERRCMETKGRDYSGNKDRLANFKRNAKLLDLSPLQIWAIYFMKHIDAIMTYIKDGSVKSESIESRIMDSRVYLALLRGLIEDKREKTLPTTHTYKRRGREG